MSVNFNESYRLILIGFCLLENCCFMLQLDLQQFLEKVDPSTMYVRKQTFCYTLAGNPVPVLTITAPPDFSVADSEAEAIEELSK